MDKIKEYGAPRFGDSEHVTELHRNLKPKTTPCHTYDPKYKVYKEPH